MDLDDGEASLQEASISSHSAVTSDTNRAAGPKVIMQKVEPSLLVQWTLMSKQYPEGMPFHGPVLNRKEASAVALFSAFELKTFRDIYRTWATNVWRLRAYRRMQHNILRWRNASVAGAFDTWHVNQHQLRVLRVIAARFSHHGEQRGFEHCFCLWRQTTHQVKVARRRAARVLAGRVYRSLLVGMWACWRRLGAALARERQVLAQVKGMWMNPLLMRCVQSWHELLIQSKASSINSRVLAAWAGASVSMSFGAWKTLVHAAIAAKKAPTRPEAVDRLHLRINAAMEHDRLGCCPGLPLNPHRLNSKLVPPHVPLVSPHLARLRKIGWSGAAEVHSRYSLCCCKRRRSCCR